MASRRRGALEWAGLIDEWKHSGLSLPKFCGRRGLKTTTMCGWVYKPALKRAIETARRNEEVDRERPAKVRPSPGLKASPAFVPVRLRELISGRTIEPIDRSAIEVIVGAGRRVSVGPGFDSETLKRVIATLESSPC